MQMNQRTMSATLVECVSQLSVSMKFSAFSAKASFPHRFKSQTGVNYEMRQSKIEN